MNGKTWTSLIVLVLLSSVTAIAQEKKVWDEAPPALQSLKDLDYREYLPEAAVSDRTAYRLNDLGLQAYEEDDLLEAARLFRLALEMNGENAFAHYNYAAMLAVFAQGFRQFDAPPQVIMTWSREEYDKITEYREEIFRHLKISIALRPERLDRVKEDSDFDSVRGLSEYEYLLMGRNPSVEKVVRIAPKWYSIQPGAFLPEDTFEFLPGYRLRFEYDSRQLELFSDTGEVEDRSFTGRYRIEGNRLIIFPEGSGDVIHGEFSLRLDGLGFVVQRRLQVEGFGPFSDEESHYWEGQDG
jgi:tetratricopeptide (TPR) repeat protein